MVASKLNDYLCHVVSLLVLVSWAESVMMEADLNKKGYEVPRDIVSSPEFADLRARLGRLPVLAKYCVDITIWELSAAA